MAKRKSDVDKVLSEAISISHRRWRYAKQEHNRLDNSRMRSYWHGEMQAHLATLAMLREIRKNIKPSADIPTATTPAPYPPTVAQ